MILLVGATGYTGGYVLKALRRAGERVLCLIRDPGKAAALEADGVQTTVGDLTDPDRIEGLARVDAVVSAAHIRFAKGLVRLCERAGARRVVALSSTWRHSRIVTQDVRDVIDGERALSGANLDATILRPTMIYGPGNDRNVSRLRAHIQAKPVFPVFGNGERMVQPVYVEDVADAVSAVLRRTGTHGKSYDIAGGAPITYSEMIDLISASVGRAPLKVYIPLFAAVPLARLYGMLSRSPAVRVDQIRRMAEDRCFEIEDAVRDFGYRPRGFEDGLRLLETPEP